MKSSELSQNLNENLENQDKTQQTSVKIIGKVIKPPVKIVIAKQINIAVFGKGKVGSSLISQILKSSEKIFERKRLKINIFAVSGKDRLLLSEHGISENWLSKISELPQTTEIVTNVINFAKQARLDNLIAVDNTASAEFTKHYNELISNGFNLVSSNKIANTQSYEAYKKLRETLDFTKRNIFTKPM